MDEQAFGDFIERWRPRLVAMGRERYGLREDDAEDAYQAASLKVFAAYRQGRMDLEHPRAPGYLLQTYDWAIRDYWRTIARKPLPSSWEEEPARPDGDPTLPAEQEDEVLRVRAALYALVPEMRAAAEARLAGESHRELGSRCDLKPGAMLVRMRIAWDFLRVALQQ
ncbi:MAG: sigma-70 family RNA polymerase sigma factor, partial [Candidatus Aenigmarchaeota archaeon]|nr:sigma-70 family RNA polymerase sigma factor [Candidatus Aenigmarchaeota archaeon]